MPAGMGSAPLRLPLPSPPFGPEQVVNLRDVVEKVEGGVIDPAALITMKTLKVSPFLDRLEGTVWRNVMPFDEVLYDA